MTNNNSFYRLECFLCQNESDEKKNYISCEKCGGPLTINYDYDVLKNQLNSYLIRNAPPKVVKYIDFYPLRKRDSLVSLGAGGTTLYKASRLGEKLGLSDLYIKDEGLNPTGAFKDRGSFVEINKACELGYDTVCVASTGNMAASVAAYSAQAGLSCFVFVPEGSPRGKLAQALSYGASVIQVRGTYSEVYDLTLKVAKRQGYYLAGDYAYRAEGQKSLSYEICEQMWFGDVDWVIVPVGMGTNLSSVWKGFWEYKKMDLISSVPKLVAVQAEGCSPIVEAYTKNKKIKKVSKPQTVCSAISVGNPIDGPKVLSALSDSKGLAVSVSDDEALLSQQELARYESLYVEPSSATAIAALKKLVKRKKIKAGDKVVCIATGDGLKDPAVTLKILAEPPTIEPIAEDARRVIKSGVLSLRAGAFGEREKSLFLKVPDSRKLKKTVKEEFGFDLSADDLETVKRVISKFIKIKGKKIAKADLQSIIETIIQDQRRKKTLHVVDYHVETYKEKKPKAEVKIKLNGQTYTVEKNGVGPVDAAINAILYGIRKKDKVKLHLTDFSVEIPTTGSDATVEVSMVLQDEYGTQVVEKGTSPDIIVASIEAFEKGYNQLVYQRRKKIKP